VAQTLSSQVRLFVTRTIGRLTIALSAALHLQIDPPEDRSRLSGFHSDGLDQQLRFYHMRGFCDE
jgi:hypothetical protein